MNLPQIETTLTTISVSYAISILLHLAVELPILNTCREIFFAKFEKTVSPSHGDSTKSVFTLAVLGEKPVE